MMLCMALFGGCGRPAKETVTNRKIPVGDVTEFYYTVENINYDAFFRRYRFYTEDGKYYFSHETRERPGQYGPTTEDDITNSGTRELSLADWKSFLAYLKDGKVSARKNSAESGDSGPWTFIYWKNDKEKYQVFEFPDYVTTVRFEEYCTDLARSDN